MKKIRNGFTIVEMLVVIAVIAILAGAITVGVNGMFYKSRLGRAKAMCTILQSGLETFYARTGEWPAPLQKLAEDSADQDSIELVYDKVDECFRTIVRVSVGSAANPVMDPSGLFVSHDIAEGCTDIHRAWEQAVKDGVVGAGSRRCSGKCARGQDFTEATKKGARNRITLDKMNFGYQGPNHGRFCRFRLFYYPKSDTVKVMLQPAAARAHGKYPNGFTDD